MIAALLIPELSSQEHRFLAIYIDMESKHPFSILIQIPLAQLLATLDPRLWAKPSADVAADPKSVDTMTFTRTIWLNQGKEFALTLILTLRSITFTIR